ncbi:NAD-dependent epimerase/dehydratase family protein [Desertivirga xinjiangensis]|uniref:NAD-dependent epimerase/dehydratase family protein n=1 Tax=Desertivirga xinjiangensis TaxID=539206 RepID=UPI00210CA8A9|nr:NAD-dependent epimerase/dehydratase family protein [Pedobacter xinjiangensis]
MHTILGAGGPVSNALAAELAKTSLKIRLVSRNHIQTHGNTTWMKGDLLNYPEVLQAVKGSEVIYLCAGLKYDKAVWQQQWPVVMENVIKATRETQARLIFFDNVYMYGHVKGPITEDCPYKPISVKGEVRAKIASLLMDEVKAGNIRASIARAADFYGATDSMNSFFDMMVLEKYSKKQKALWLGKPETLHAFTYVPDAARGVFLLGQNPDTDNQIWHLPTAKALTGHEFIRLAAGIFKTEPKFMKVNKLMLKTLGLFNQAIKGTVEMYYQYEYDYNFISDKFEKRFPYTPVTYRAGIEHLFATYYNVQRE